MKISEVTLIKDELLVNYVLSNNTKHPIWFCSDIDDKGQLDYEVIIIDAKEVIFRIANVKVPDNILLEEPIWGKYAKLLPGDSLKKSIKASAPLSGSTAFRRKTKEGGKKRISYAGSVSLEIGIFSSDLFELKSICCRDDTTSETAFVSSFWAENNKEEIVRARMESLHIPILTDTRL